MARCLRWLSRVPEGGRAGRGARDPGGSGGRRRAAGDATQTILARRRLAALVAAAAGVLVFASRSQAHDAGAPAPIAARAAAAAPEGSGYEVAAATVETVAGGGPVGDGGPATAARLALPGGLAIAPNGDLVIVDFGHHRIRRVDHRTGIIETMAGTGEAGWSGDGIPANRSRLSRPEYAAFGPQGDLFIVDEYNHRIRRVDHRTGIIDTVAGYGVKGFAGDGGPALRARFHQPEGITVDSAGNLYVGDTLNGRIRKIDAASGRISTVAGNGELGSSPDGTPGPEASFLRIARLAADGAGNIYIADSPAQKIRVLDAASGRIRTLVGTGEAGFSGDGGPAPAARVSFPEGPALDSRGNFYFCDLGNHRVRRVDASTGIISTIAGTGEKGFAGDGGPALAARLWSPGRLALDHEDNLYIGDTGNSRVRFVDRRTGIIRTVAGNGELGDGGPALQGNLTIPGDLVYAQGKVYVADFGNRRVRAVDLGSGVIRTVAGGGPAPAADGAQATAIELLLPEGIAVDRDGRDLYIADNLASRVWRVDLTTGVLHAFAGNGEVGYSGDGGPARDARLRLPAAVTAAPDGTVYISDFGNRRIRVVERAGGSIHDFDLAASDHGLLGVAAVSLEATATHLYRIVLGDPDVQAVDLHTGELRSIRLDAGRFPSQYGETQIMDLSLSGDRLYVADALAQRILEVNLASGRVRSVAGSGEQGFASGDGEAADAALFQPGGVAAGEAGEIFIADTKNHLVRRVRLAVSPASPAGAAGGAGAHTPAPPPQR